MPELPFLRPIVRLEDAAALDPIIARVKPLVLAVLKPRALEDALHGVQAGHPVHPVLVQVPIGTWTSAALLDLLPGASRFSRLLIGAGVLSSATAILAGWADWSRSAQQQQRVGIVHAATNEIATVLYALSWLDRRRGHEVRGRVLSYTAYAGTAVGGYLGGHLGYRQAVGVNHAEGIKNRFPVGWQVLGSLEDLPEGRPAKREVAGEPLVVVRRGDRVDVLSNVCTHLAGDLSEGEVTTVDGEACITCPLHDSVFALDSGEVVHGPSSAPEPRFDVRVTGDMVEVRLPGAAG